MVRSPNVVSLTWSAPPPSQQNGVIRYYHINQNETNTGILTTYTRGGDHNELVVRFLHPHYEYLFSISAETVEQGPFSDAVAVTTLEAG